MKKNMINILLSIHLGLSLFASTIAGRQLSIPCEIGKPAKEFICKVSTGPVVPILALAFSPDNKILAVAGYQEVLLWDLSQAKLSKRLTHPKMQGTVRALAFIDKNRLIVGDGRPAEPGMAHIFNIQTGKVAKQFSNFKDAISAIAVSADKKSLALGDGSGALQVIDLQDYKIKKQINDFSSSINDLGFSDDNKVLAVASSAGFVRVWQCSDWKICAINNYDASVTGLQFFNKGRQIVISIKGEKESYVTIIRCPTKPIDPKRLAIIKKKSGKKTGRSPQKVVLKKGKPLGVVFANWRFYLPCTDNNIKIVRLKPPIIKDLKGHDSWVYSLAISPQGSIIASGDANGKVCLWNGFTGSLLGWILHPQTAADQWLILSKNGFFTSSDFLQLSWFNSNDKEVDAKIINQRLNKPELLQNQFKRLLTAKTTNSKKRNKNNKNRKNIKKK